MAIEAFRIATQFMTPVILLSDGYLANGAEPWSIPDVASLPKIVVKNVEHANGNGFHPYTRDDMLSRPWALPGTPGLEHRLGGLEKANITGNVDYSPENHQAMINLRAQKVANVAKVIPPLEVHGAPKADLLVLGWGGTAGSIRTAVEELQAAGKRVSYAHLRYLNPFPSNTGEVLRNFKKVLVPELNMGQLLMLIRAKYLVDAVGLDKVQGRPFMVSEIVEKAQTLLS
jgi:2-oxoglutarate ferredoxin oxidoreductase subunit alpha